MRHPPLVAAQLSPLDSFASELGVRFGVRLEARHVVDLQRAVFAATIGVGPTRVALAATYAAAATTNWQDEVRAAAMPPSNASQTWRAQIGRVVTDVCRRTPHGVLVFVASYSMLARLTRRWQTTGAWAALLALKSIFVEAGGGSGGGGGESTPNDDDAGAARSTAGAEFASLIARYYAEARTSRGCAQCCAVDRTR